MTIQSSVAVCARHPAPHSAAQQSKTTSIRVGASRAAALCALAAAVVGAAATDARAGWWALTNLHPSGAYHSAAAGVSGGQQVGYTGIVVGSQIFTHASLWNGSAGWVDLSPAGTSFSVAVATSGSQQVGRVITADGKTRAALWNGTAASWIDLSPPGSFESWATAISGGQEVGKARFNPSTADFHAILWNGTSSWVNLNPPGAVFSEAQGVSGGQQVGFAGIVVASQVQSHAMLWTGTAASAVDLNPSGKIHSRALGVSAGRQVGYVDVSGDSHASLWTGSAISWVDLNPAAATNSCANAIFGTQQVGYATIGGNRHASLWGGTAGSWVDLHTLLPAVYTSSEASGIWSDTTFIYIAGHAINSITGQREAKLWRWSNQKPIPVDSVPLRAQRIGTTKE